MEQEEKKSGGLSGAAVYFFILAACFGFVFWLPHRTASQQEKTAQTSTTQKVSMTKKNSKAGNVKSEEGKIKKGSKWRQEYQQLQIEAAELVKGSKVGKQSKYRKMLERMQPYEPKIKQLLEQFEEYPLSIVELFLRNNETIDYVIQYPKHKKEKSHIKITAQDLKKKIPLFLQWDQRWGYASYGNEVMALNGCGPTCLSMVVVGLTKDTTKNPYEIAKFSVKEGFFHNRTGTGWLLMTEGAKKLGIVGRELSLDSTIIRNELQKGHPIICSMKPGKFTTTGHFVVLYDVTKEGKICINDPNSILKSKQMWEFSEIRDEIKNLWVYTASK